LSNLNPLFVKGYPLRKNNKNAKKKSRVIDLTQTNEIPQVYRNRLKPKTENQANYIRTIVENSITFCHGIAGSGKTHIAIGLALEYLLDEKVKKIIITRPVVESGEKIGYLPGTAEEKLHPYLLPLLDEIAHFINPGQLSGLKTTGKIEIVPLGLMRGRNFHDAFIVADECQNASYDQIKMLLTRLGNNSKMVLTGDTSQSDLHRHMRGGFAAMVDALTGVDSIGMCSLQCADIIRNPLIGKILSRLDNYESEK